MVEKSSGDDNYGQPHKKLLFPALVFKTSYFYEALFNKKEGSAVILPARREE